VNQAANYLIGGQVPQPMGNEHPNIVPYQAFGAADRAFVVAAGNDRLFRRLCEAIGHADRAEDPRWETDQARVRNRRELISLLPNVFKERPAIEWLGKLAKQGVPCAPVHTLAEVFASPEGAGLVEELPDGDRGPVRLVRNPLRFERSRLATRLPPPAIGETNPSVWLQVGEEHDGGH
jgi:crotonobetainyl-CoA:carnitine CoA-transferase CaiB-like acyl-CoA transferase